MKGIYVLAFMMFLGLVITIYSSYRMMNIVEERKFAVPGGVQSKNPETPPIMITDPELQPYLTGSFFGMALFFVGAIGGLIAIVKAFTRRF
jgi:hypothetical protein